MDLDNSVINIPEPLDEMPEQQKQLLLKDLRQYFHADLQSLDMPSYNPYQPPGNINNNHNLLVGEGRGEKDISEKKPYLLFINK